jgi:hypothetical protein
MPLWRLRVGFMCAAQMQMQCYITYCKCGPQRKWRRDLRRTIAQAAKAEAARLLALLAVFRLDVAPQAMEPVEEAIVGLSADRVRPQVPMLLVPCAQNPLISRVSDTINHLSSTPSSTSARQRYDCSTHIGSKV